MKEITDPGRIGYYVDENDRQCLAVNIEGLALEKDETVWIWVHKPQRLGSTGYRYPNTIPVYDCGTENSLHVGLAESPTHSRANKEDPARLWIPLAVPSTEIDEVQYLLLPTDLLDVEGWGRVLPTW